MALKFARGSHQKLVRQCLRIVPYRNNGIQVPLRAPTSSTARPMMGFNIVWQCADSCFVNGIL